jgi:hypothetical protein
MLHARGRAHHHRGAPAMEEVLLRLHAVATERAQLPTPLQVVADLGAQIDGLILTADPDGTPRDEFAWCLTVPHPWGTPLARVLIPASRRHTAWHDPVDNILAAIALSSWHPTPKPDLHPQASTSGPTPAVESAPENRAEVRVLDIDATTSTGRPRTHSSTPRQAHLRRGHWRHQRVGPGRHHTRPTWVRPTTVNPSSDTSTATQIYRLPTVPTAQ